MSYKRILTIQDISCVGQCSLTVALPIISACGIECSVLPSAVLSTHTSGFSGYTFRDLTDDMPAIRAHWEKESLKFDAVYTGYLGSSKQIDYVIDIFNTSTKENAVKIVDPAMADNGRLYPGFDAEYVEAMKKLCASADYILPNITEACFLTGVKYQETPDREYIDWLLSKLLLLGAKTVVLTGVSYKEGRTGIVVATKDSYEYYEHELLSNSCHGTGDIYASSFTGALVNGHSAYEAAKIAGDYTLECIKETAKIQNHTYGAAFEKAIPKLIEML